MMRFLWITVILGVARLSSAHMEAPPKKALPDKNAGTKQFRLEMPGIKPKADNTYMCTAVKVPEGNNYIVHYEPKAEMSIAHHVLLFGCDKPASTRKTWSCGQVCGGYSSPSIYYAWAKNAAGLDLPKDTGFKIGGENSKYLVLQVHYAKAFTSEQKPDHTAIELHYTPEHQPYLAGVYILMAYSAAIPPKQKAFDVDMSCRFDGDRPIYPFAFRTHAHKLGRSIGGYFNNGSWYIIGEGNPQLPQAFYPVNTTDIVIKPNDLVSGRCTFNSMSMNHVVSIGATDKDEMCNFYIMYSTPNIKNAQSYYECGGNDYYDKLEDRPDHSRMRKHEVVFDENWSPATKLGQVTGVSTDRHGNVWIFHRAQRQWSAHSFNVKNEFDVEKYGVIKENTIVQLDKNGKLLQEFGADMFYMPHGLHVDHHDNLWLTDVAMHQVFMIPAGQKSPSLTLGTKFKPGNGPKSFCKPASVATLKTGEFFVADGYCNSRVLKYKSAENATLLTQWGKPALTNIDPTTGIPPPGTFNTVHSITVAEDKNLVCVSDREDGRIQCFDYDGKFVEMVESPLIGSRIFAASYHPRDGGTLYIVNGREFPPRDGAVDVSGFTVDLTTGTVLQKWQPTTGFTNPHDVTVSRDGEHVYVAEIGPNRIWRFNITDNIAQGGASLAVKKTTGSVHGGASTWRAGKKLLSSDSDTLASVIIGALLVIPIIIIIIITVIIRLRKTGRLRLNKNYRNGGKLSLAGLLTGKHRGFDRLNTEESDELEHLSDSEAEDYSARNTDIQHT